MVKTIETDVVVANINEKAAADKHAAAMKNLPSPAYDDHIPWDLVIADKSFNVRMSEKIDGADFNAYSVANNTPLYQSLKESGLIKRDPMTFSRYPNGSLKVLAGHLRYAMMAEIRREEIERREKNGEPSDPASLPFNVIHGLVFDKLSADQETLLMADHIMRKDLTEPERAKEIGEFLRAYPISEAKAAVHFGEDKSKLQRLKMRWLMPTVYTEFVKEKTKGYTGHFYKVDQKTLTALYSAFLLDQSANNGAYRQEGPAFRAAWSKFVADQEVFKEPAANKDPRKDLDTLDGMITSATTTHGNTPEVAAVRDALRWAAGRPGEDGEPVNLNRVIENLLDYVTELKVTIQGLKDEIDRITQPDEKPVKAKAKMHPAK